MRLLDGAEARAIDRIAIDDLGIPGPVLMENAALAAAEVIERRFALARGGGVVWRCGITGGDGLALARQLATRGVHVVALLAASDADVRGDAAIELRALRAAIAKGGDGSSLELREIGEASLDLARAALARADLVVDALFGI